MIAIPNMDKPKSCDGCPFKTCFIRVNIKSCTCLINGEECGKTDCPLIEIDENDPVLLEFLNEFDKWRAYKEVMNYIKSVYKEGEANDIR